MALKTSRNSLASIKEYGAKIGIHVIASGNISLNLNTSAKRFYVETWTETYVRLEPDQGINIDAEYDLSHGRLDRWKELRENLRRLRLHPWPFG